MDLQFFGGRGGKSGRKDKSELVQGVSQEQIDKLRGTRDHQDILYDQDIINDYARVGITINKEQAQFVREAVYDFSSTKYEDMRNALSKERNGEQLSIYERNMLNDYKLREEYCKIAPVYQGKNTEIYRGIQAREGSDYAQKLMNLKVGDIWDLDKMPSSFSTDKSVARDYASVTNGIMIHASTKNLKNSPSIQGLARHKGEKEILVAKYDWKITKIDDQRIVDDPTKSIFEQRLGKDGFYHVYIE